MNSDSYSKKSSFSISEFSSQSNQLFEKNNFEDINIENDKSENIKIENGSKNDFFNGNTNIKNVLINGCLATVRKPFVSPSLPKLNKNYFNSYNNSNNNKNNNSSSSSNNNMNNNEIYNNNNRFSYSTTSSIPFDNFSRNKYLQPISMAYNNMSHYGENEIIQNSSNISNNNNNNNNISNNNNNNNNNQNNNQNNQNNNSTLSNYGNSNSQSSHTKNSRKYLFSTVPPGRGVFPIPFSLR